MEQWKFFTSKEIKPAGWLKRQLEIQAEGLSGNLDKVWPDVRDSKWIGGTCEGWERVPYWLDGFIPLAYLLENEDLIARAKKYIDAIISFQKPDGWICPCTDEERLTYDTWAVLLITKVLTVYYECSGDERIPDVLYRTEKNYYDMLKAGTIKLDRWGKFRWFEGFIAVNFLYERTKEDWLKDLAKILKAQGADYPSYMEEWKTPVNQWQWHTHIVNIAMMMKFEAVSHTLLGEEYKYIANGMYETLYRYNGTPVELFTGDECLSGCSPIQGTELCAVVELMYSYEHLYACTKDPIWAERLEVLAFNALPAAISDDMWTHQYDQQSNQIACMKYPDRSPFRTNRNDANLFGLEPHFGCCTANFNQGWPKFVLSTYLHKDNIVENVVPVPSVLTTEDYSIRLETSYPFGNDFTYTVSAKKDFRFQVRIPSFAKNLTVNGQAVIDGNVSFDINANSETVIHISYETEPHFINRPHDLTSVKCGSLVFSLPIAYEPVMMEYTSNNVERKFPYCDYEYLPKSDWSYGYADKMLQAELRPISDIPFSSKQPAMVIKAHVQKINWGMADGFRLLCDKTPQSRAPIGEAEEIELYPYGCAKLRMTEMPLLKK